jgi:hypothetical protein
LKKHAATFGLPAEEGTKEELVYALRAREGVLEDDLRALYMDCYYSAKTEKTTIRPFVSLMMHVWARFFNGGDTLEQLLEREPRQFKQVEAHADVWTPYVDRIRAGIRPHRPEDLAEHQKNLLAMFELTQAALERVRRLEQVSCTTII